jgi:hypothetical protein
MFFHISKLAKPKLITSPKNKFTELNSAQALQGL